MTVPASDRRNGPYIGTGLIVPFSFTFKVFEEEDLLVVRALLSTGVTTDLVLNSDYRVVLNVDQETSPGGVVYYQVASVDAALPITNSLTIVGNLPYTQPVDITNQGGFYPQVIEDALDRTVMLVQQLGDAVSRSLQLNVATDPDASVVLPVPTASNLLGWSADGLSLQNYPPDATYPASVLAAQLADTSSASPGASLVGLSQDDANAVGTDLAERGRKWVLDTDFDTIQHAIDYCNSGGDAKGLLLTTFHQITPGSPLIINRPTSTPSSSRGKFVIKGMTAQAGFGMYGAGYMFENSIVGFSENIVFENVWFQSDHSGNGGTNFTGVMKVADFIRVTFRECYFQEVGVEPDSATYAQSFYFDHCKFVSWNGPIMSVLAFYDLSVVGCQYESGNYADSKGFVAYDGTSVTSTQGASFLSNLYENCTGSFANIQNGRGVTVEGLYAENVTAPVLDFSQGTPRGINVSACGFDTSGAAASYAPILLSRVNGFVGGGNWSSTRLYTIQNQTAADGTDQGGSIGQGDRTDSGQLLSSSSVAIDIGMRMPGGIQSFRLGDPAQGATVGYQDGIFEGYGGAVLESVNRGSATYLPLVLRQRNNAGTRNLLYGMLDGTVVTKILTTSPTLTENLSMAVIQATTTSLRFEVRCSDGVTRTANLTLS